MRTGGQLAATREGVLELIMRLPDGHFFWCSRGGEAQQNLCRDTDRQPARVISSN